MKKFYQKLGNIPCLITFGVLAIIGYAINILVGLLLGGETFEVIYQLGIVALYVVLLIVAVMNKRVATLGIFTLTLGAFALDFLTGGIDQLISLKDIFAAEDSWAGAYGVSTLLTGICNILFVVGIAFYFVGKFVLKQRKKVVVECMLTSFTVSMILFIASVIVLIAGGVFAAYNSKILVGIDISYDICQLADYLFILAAGAFAESVSKKE